MSVRVRLGAPVSVQVEAASLLAVNASSRSRCHELSQPDRNCLLRHSRAEAPAEVRSRSRFVVHDVEFLFWRRDPSTRTARPRDDMRQPATTKATRALSQIAETLDRAGVVLLRRLASFPRPLCP